MCCAACELSREWCCVNFSVDVSFTLWLRQHVVVVGFWLLLFSWSLFWNWLLWFVSFSFASHCIRIEIKNAQLYKVGNRIRIQPKKANFNKVHASITCVLSCVYVHFGMSWCCGRWYGDVDFRCLLFLFFVCKCKIHRLDFNEIVEKQVGAY